MDVFSAKPIAVLQYMKALCTFSDFKYSLESVTFVGD